MRALTGTDPDRLKEEKERGITIELGFAHARLSDEVTASFVDVPGHERFVRHMLAGAHGIDAVLLVVAADESVMPQTREHFQICRLLGIARGLVALTKCDLADAELQAIAELEVRDLVAGSFLQGSPVLHVSARSGEGLSALREAMVELARTIPQRSAAGLLRLPLDRVFSLKGFGTVVTGTLVSGELREGEEVEALPSATRARVRGLQVHGESVVLAGAGSRTAVNLGGVEVEALARGEVLVRPGTLRSTSMVDVELSLLPDARELRDGARVRVHAASAERLGRVRLLGSATLEPGSSGVAQLRLEAPLVAGRGDRLVLRSYSPAATIAGAVVLDPLAPRRRDTDAALLSALRGANAMQAATAFAEQAGAAGLDLPSLAARLTQPLAEASAVAAAAPALRVLGDAPGFVVSRRALDRLQKETVAALKAFHRSQPLKPGIPREELRERVFVGAAPPAFGHVLGVLEQAGTLRLLPDAVALASHEVRFSAGEEEARERLLQAAQAAGLAGVETAVLAEVGRCDPALLDRVARVLVTQRVLGRVGESMLVVRAQLDELKRVVRERWPAGSTIEVAAFKEMTGLSRKHVIPLLEFLDRERVTRRVANDRVVL